MSVSNHRSGRDNPIKEPSSSEEMPTSTEGLIPAIIVASIILGFCCYAKVFLM